MNISIFIIYKNILDFSENKNTEQNIQAIVTDVHKVSLLSFEVIHIGREKKHKRKYCASVKYKQCSNLYSLNNSGTAGRHVEILHSCWRHVSINHRASDYTLISIFNSTDNKSLNLEKK